MFAPFLGRVTNGLYAIGTDRISRWFQPLQLETRLSILRILGFLGPNTVNTKVSPWGAKKCYIYYCYLTLPGS